MLQASITTKGDLLKEFELAKDNIKEELVGGFEYAASQAVMESPVWSGAYVKSFSIQVNGSGPTRSRTSKPDVRVDPGAAKSESIAQLSADISMAYNMDLEDIRKLTLLNRARTQDGAELAQIVESGTPTQPSGGIFARFRNRIGSLRGAFRTYTGRR